MTEALHGKTLVQARCLFNDFHAAVTQDDVGALEQLGKLKVLIGVKAYPARVKCATLAWHTLQAALENDTAVTTTE